jgi:hypothetical protein
VDVVSRRLSEFGKYLVSEEDELPAGVERESAYVVGRQVAHGIDFPGSHIDDGDFSAEGIGDEQLPIFIK